ncbi:MAG TPA: hypothetical protein VGE52_07260 [Pirellulales bacterium]
MASISEALEECLKLEGATAAALVDWKSGMCLGTAGGERIDLEVAAAGNTEVVRAKMRVMANLKLADKIEDILITLGKEYHLIRLVEVDPNLFLYLILRRDVGNLALARRKLSTVEKDMKI